MANKRQNKYGVVKVLNTTQIKLKYGHMRVYFYKIIITVFVHMYVYVYVCTDVFNSKGVGSGFFAKKINLQIR